MKRIVLFLMSTLTVVVLLFGYHTSTSSKAAGGETSFVSTGQAGTSTLGSIATLGSTSAAPSVVVTVPTTASTAAPTTSTAGTSATTTSAKASAATTSAKSSTSKAATTTSAASTSTSATASSATTTTATTSTITGSVADTRWGPVQVQLTVVTGKIVSVAVVQYPNGNGRDQEINANALPILVQETIAAQSAKIDMVSGATITSDGYLTSLQSALDQL